ncbi:MAG: hypothetical protein NTZ80_01330 [Patescibacteria group bacterium]|nr:hypothetical protein [Patescibacteria group bacterium]
MKLLNLSKIGSLALLSLIVLIASLFHVKEINSLYTAILGVATFLMGIFIAFSISDRHSRIDELRRNDSVERSKLILLYNFSKYFGEKKHKAIQNVTDEYLMATLDYSVWDYNETEPNFRKIVDEVCQIKPKNGHQSVLFDNMLSILDSLTTARRETIGIIQDRLSKFEWGIFFFLSIVIVISLLFINSGSFMSVLIISILSLTIFLILNLLYTLDNLSWKVEVRIFEPYQQAFEAMDLMRYYSEDTIAGKMVKNHLKHDYRMGIFPGVYPDLSGKQIKIIRRRK